MSQIRLIKFAFRVFSFLMNCKRTSKKNFKKAFTFRYREYREDPHTVRTPRYCFCCFAALAPRQSYICVFCATLGQDFIFGAASKLEMATGQRTRPRAVVDAPRRAAWRLKSVLRHSAEPRTIVFYICFYNYCW